MALQKVSPLRQEGWPLCPALMAIDVSWPRICWSHSSERAEGASSLRGVQQTPRRSLKWASVAVLISPSATAHQASLTPVHCQNVAAHDCGVRESKF